MESEVSRMQSLLSRKKEADSRQIKFLSGEVDTLKGELEKAQSSSMLDGLTGAYNRRAFDSHIADLIEGQSEAFSLSFGIGL